MSKRKDPRVTGPHQVVEAGGNIFEAIGFSGGEAAELQMRAQLMVALKDWRVGRKLTQVQAAKILEVPQSRISEIERGKFELFSLDTLVRLAERAGLQPRLSLAA
ncbi:MAG TPA: helix-turn-helix transcriptional regulator [Nevskia sp.]|nr:helix-turn-helix transcriptional regulator [Nevskia sp.]